MNEAKKLRKLINSGKPFIAADSYSVMTARIVERVGFKCAYLGGHACGAFHYGVPDNGIFSQVEQIEQAARIAASIDIPLIVDADTLGETIADAYHFIRRYERAGIAGIHVEDEVNPKHSTLVNGLIPTEEMQAKLEACVKARQDPSFVIIARCDELFTEAFHGGGAGNVQHAIKRGKAYIEAGADVLVFPGSSPEANAKLVKALSVPVCAMGPSLPGAAFTLSTGWGMPGAAKTHIQRATQLFETGEIELDNVFEGKSQLTDEDIYDTLIRD